VKEPYERDDILQKRRIIFCNLLIVATCGATSAYTRALEPHRETRRKRGHGSCERSHMCRIVDEN